MSPCFFPICVVIKSLQGEGGAHRHAKKGDDWIFIIIIYTTKKFILKYDATMRNVVFIFSKRDATAAAAAAADAAAAFSKQHPISTHHSSDL